MEGMRNGATRTMRRHHRSKLVRSTFLAIPGPKILARASQSAARKRDGLLPESFTAGRIVPRRRLPERSNQGYPPRGTPGPLPLWHRRLRQSAYLLLRAVGIRSVKVRVRGRPLWIDLRDTTLGRYFWVFRTYEPFEAELIERAAQTGMTAVDIGVNVGYLTVLLGHRVGAAGNVIAFEPDPTNFALLERSVEA